MGVEIYCVDDDKERRQIAFDSVNDAGVLIANALDVRLQAGSSAASCALHAFEGKGVLLVPSLPRN
jgi:hypothetical protein